MISLTQVAYYSRRAITLGIIALLVLVFITPVIQLGQVVLTPPTKPTPTSAPTVIFGKLPKIKFEKNQIPPTSLTYELETIDGKVPSLTNFGDIYFIPKNLPTFFDFEQATKFASALGFTQEPIAVAKTTYQFLNDKLPYHILTIEIISDNFHYIYDHQKEATKSSVFVPGKILYPQQVINDAYEWLRAHGLARSDLDSENPITQVYTYENGKFVTSKSLSDNQVVRVNFFKKPIKNIPILNDRFGLSHIFLVYSNSNDSNKKLLEVKYTYWNINYKNASTYPLKSSQEAWEELKGGQGYIAKAQEGSKKAVIRNAYVAYLETETFQDYLQPIFVFEGDNDFVAYIAAVDRQWSL